MKNTFALTGLLILLFLLTTLTFAQEYEIDASDVKINTVENLFRMGHAGPAGKEIEVTTEYLTLGGKPVAMTMGEVHFSRMNPELWEETILKMKACGIDIIATYLFWNYHEEIEGQYEQDGRNNLRVFLELCGKHDVYAFPRTGPWSHGEARLGGMPDWIVRKENVVGCVLGPAYMIYVERYYKEISRQCEGLYYKDERPIIGRMIKESYMKCVV